MAPARPLLIVAAWEPELAFLRALLERRPRRDVVGRAVGVGLIEAAAGTARALAEVQPRALVLVGTAGVYRQAPRAPAIGAAAVVRRAHLASLTVATGAAYLPAPLPSSVDSAPALRRPLRAAARGPAVDVACPLGITRSHAAARRLAAATHAALENLETFAVARAAAVAGIPFAAVLGVANRVGPHAHAEWTANATGAAAAACAVVARALLGWAPR